MDGLPDKALNCSDPRCAKVGRLEQIRVKCNPALFNSIFKKAYEMDPVFS